MSGIHLWFSGLLQRVWVTSPAPPSAAHTAHLLGSCWLHSTAAAAAGDHPVVLASPKCWGLLLQLGRTFTNSLSWTLFMVPSPTFLHDPFNPEASTGTPACTVTSGLSRSSQCQASAALHDPFRTSSIWETLTRDPVWLPAQSPTLATSGTERASVC